MSVRGALMLEVRVALSRKAQPIWFRVLKWTVLLAVGAFLWRGSHFWWWICGALGLGLTLHLVWRWKTKRWTRAWGGATSTPPEVPGDRERTRRALVRDRPRQRYHA